MKTIPTAQNFLRGDDENEPWTGDIEDAMIEFAKLHVEAAITECIESAPSGSSLFKENQKLLLYFLDAFGLNQTKPEKGKLYPVPEGYEIKIEKGYVDLGSRERLKEYAILVPKQEGLYQKYVLHKVDGTPIDENAEYFVLRLDLNSKDPHHIAACRKAIHTYADAIEATIPELAKDLRDRYPLQPYRLEFPVPGGVEGIEMGVDPQPTSIEEAAQDACKKIMNNGINSMWVQGFIAGHNYQEPKMVCAKCGGTGIIKGGPTDSRPDESCTCQFSFATKQPTSITDTVSYEDVVEMLKDCYPNKNIK
jgi:hypothetical protein